MPSNDKVLGIIIVGGGLVLDFSVVGLLVGIPLTLIGIYLLFRRGRRG